MTMTTQSHSCQPRRGQNAGRVGLGARLRAGAGAFALAVGLCAAFTAPALAGPPEPRLKPAQPAQSKVVSASDLRTLREAFQAAEAKDWRAVERASATVSDPIARKLIIWRRAASDAGMSFFELDAALVELNGWPSTSVIQSEAEAKMSASGMSPTEVIAWFEARQPRSGRGKIAYAEALMAAGRQEEGVERLKAAWRSDLLPLSLQSEVAKRHARTLTRADHEARVDALLWQGHRSSAKQLLTYLSANQRRLAEARIALIGRERGVDTAIDRVPRALQADPGLVFERAKWRRRAGRADDALPLMLDIPASVPTEEGRQRVWGERRVYIARALTEGDSKTAYRLASNAGLTDGVDFADSQFLAGWLALRRLNQPEIARDHFQTLADGVSTPVSTARARYWLGRAAEDLGEASVAKAEFTAAAEHPTTYYGQLAAERIGVKALTLPTSTTIDAETRARFEAREPVKALKLLSELHDDNRFRTFAYHLDDLLDTPGEIALLAELARDYGQTGAATRAGKAGLARGVVAPEAAYPVIDLPKLGGGAPEEALLFALMRQESEFYSRAISSVGARGLMQIMPATAQSTARRIGEPYRKNWLTDDADYNVRLGAAYLGDLLDEFDGSYVLAAAAYNAGPSRARRWVSDNGDLRGGGVDPVDWVESIPFSETRNYVQRLMENTQVYRARLSNDGSAPIAITADIRRGG